MKWNGTPAFIFQVDEILYFFLHAFCVIYFVSTFVYSVA